MWQWTEDDCEVKHKTATDIFEETFISYFDLFESRVNHLAELPKGSLDYKNYLDLSLIQLRALCIEYPCLKNSYTLQNYLYVHDMGEKAAEVDKFFNVNIGDSMTLSEAIKVTTDKYIAHYDTATNCHTDDYNYKYHTERTFDSCICEIDLPRIEMGICLYGILSFMEQIVNSVELQVEEKDYCLAWSPWL